VNKTRISGKRFNAFFVALAIGKFWRNLNQITEFTINDTDFRKILMIQIINLNCKYKPMERNIIEKKHHFRFKKKSDKCFEQLRRFVKVMFK